MRTPQSTYRLQITANWDLREAAELVPYLTRLGVDWVYLSPILEAEPGSDHGYDVIDHSRVDPARGGAEGLQAVSEAAHGAGHGVLVDIVPNHVGVASPHLSVWWWDVLAKGKDSEHARAFDVDWAAGGDKLLLPILGDGADELKALKISGGELHYYDHTFPIAEGTAGGTPEEVHARQHYELVSWRRGDSELNYRRFFSISTLAAIRVELPEIFAASHAEVSRWFRAGLVDGLRIDHPDGLADPGGYLDDLAALTDNAYVLVEKILEPGEELPATWKCQGTTGYDALALLDRLFVDPAGRDALDDLDTELRVGLRVDWTAMTTGTKRAVADTLLRAEVLRLARLVPDIEHADDAIAQLLASFTVYRSYLPLGQDHLDEAVAAAAQRRPALAGALATVSERLQDTSSEFSVRFQQTSGMVMAKGVEDSAFYRWTRLTSLTEVGADPALFAVLPEVFHAAQIDRVRDWPHTMTTLSTHDTKRGEDVRARISVLSELAAEWAEAVREWLRLVPLTDGPLANLLLQAAVGAWPVERERLQAYAEKAAREAGNSTTWTNADTEFEAQMHQLIDAVYDDPGFSAAIGRWVDRLSGPGWSNSLSSKLIQITGPGVPDVYQGSERWEMSLVDPDNRRPVDHAAASALLEKLDTGWQPPIDVTGAAKLLVTSRALRLRRDHPELFTGYTVLAATGTAADHLVAFDRGGAITLATRLPVGVAAGSGWSDATIALPAGQWRDVLRGHESELLSGEQPVAALLSEYPVALLVKEN